MTKIVLPNEQYLQKDFVEAKIVSIMEPELEWMSFMPKVQADSKAVWATREPTSAASDTARRAPRARTAGAKFVKVGVTNLEEISTTMASYGLEIRIDEDAIRYAEGIDMIDRSYRRAAYWLANDINTKIGAGLISGVASAAGGKFATKTTPAWSADGADPVGDLQLLVADMEKDEYPYELTDVYLHRDNYDELLKYLMTLDVVKGERETIWGMPNFKTPTVELPVLGVNVHRMRRGTVEGSVLGLDARFSPATYYYSRNPKYPQAEENSLGFHLNTYVDNDTHDTVFQMWLEYAILVKEPYAGIYSATGI